jgi:hypothetical protein
MVDNFWDRFQQGPSSYWPPVTPAQLAGARSATNNGGMFGSMLADDTRRFDMPTGGQGINTVGSWGGPQTGQGGTGGGGQRFLQEWIYGGNQLGGGKYLGNSQWAAGAPIAAGTDLHSLGYTTSAGYALPVGYDSNQDTFRGELKGEAGETSWSRALRKAQDMVINGQADWNTAIRQSIALVNQEAAAQGKTTGFGQATQTDTLGNPNGGGWPNGGAGQSMRGLGYTPPTSYQKDNGQEGSDVSMPGYDPGQGAGGTMPGQQPGSGTNPQYNLDLRDNKVVRMAALLDRLGLGSPMAQSNMLGGDRANRAMQLFDPWMQTQGIAGGNVADNFSGLMDKFVGYLQNSGGMGAIANDASSAARTVMTDPRFATQPDEEMMSLLQGFSQLANLPGNEWLQRAFGNIQDQSVGQYGQLLNQASHDKKPLDFNYMGYIKKDPIYGFLTGQK